MKKIYSIVIALLLFCGISPLLATTTIDLNEPNVNQAIDLALKQALPALKNAPFGKGGITILQMPNDTNGILSGKLKTLTIQAGLTCLEGKSDPMWNEIIKEIEWTERKTDILNPQTIAKFGKLTGTKILLYATIVNITKNTERIYVQIALHATDVHTREHIWGATPTYRYYFHKDVKGIVSLDNKLKKLLRKNFEEAQKSLNSKKIQGIKSVTVLPLAGDIDQYVTSLARELVNSSGMNVAAPQIYTYAQFAQLRSINRINNAGSDAILYGAVRDLKITVIPQNEYTSDKKVKMTYDVTADIELFIEDVKNGLRPWSKNIHLTERVSEFRDMTRQEIEEHRRYKLITVPDAILEWIVDNPLTIIATIAGIILLVLVAVGIKIYADNKFIR